MPSTDFDMFVNFDNDIQCTPVSTEDDIVESITSKRARVDTEKSDTEEQEKEDETEHTPVSFKEATECMTKVRDYLCQLENTAAKTFEHLFAIDKTIQKTQKLKQSTIDKFFSKTKPQ